MLLHLLPFIIPKENVHYLAVLISGHHGPVVFACGDCADVGSSSNVHLNNRANGRGGGFFFRGVNINARFPIAVLATGIIFVRSAGAGNRALRNTIRGGPILSSSHLRARGEAHQKRKAGREVTWRGGKIRPSYGGL